MKRPDIDLADQNAVHDPGHAPYVDRVLERWHTHVPFARFVDRRCLEAVGHAARGSARDARPVRRDGRAVVGVIGGPGAQIEAERPCPSARCRACLSPL